MPNSASIGNPYQSSGPFRAIDSDHILPTRLGLRFQIAVRSDQKHTFRKCQCVTRGLDNIYETIQAEYLGSKAVKIIGPLNRDRSLFDTVISARGQCRRF
jgi:hypothetical protein